MGIDGTCSSDSRLSTTGKLKFQYSWAEGDIKIISVNPQIFHHGPAVLDAIVL